MMPRPTLEGQLENDFLMDMAMLQQSTTDCLSEKMMKDVKDLLFINDIKEIKERYEISEDFQKYKRILFLVP